MMDGSAYLQSVQHDFTAPRRHHDTSILNDTIIHQVCLSAPNTCYKASHFFDKFNAAKTLDNVHRLSRPKDPLFRLKLQFSGDFLEALISTTFHFLNALCKISLLPSLAVPVLKEVSVTSEFKLHFSNGLPLLNLF